MGWRGKILPSVLTPGKEMTAFYERVKYPALMGGLSAIPYNISKLSKTNIHIRIKAELLPSQAWLSS